jgi:hypothetical protein
MKYGEDNSIAASKFTEEAGLRVLTRYIRPVSLGIFAPGAAFSAGNQTRFTNICTIFAVTSE